MSQKPNGVNQHPKQQKSWTGGFSLIELMVVVAIIGIIASFALPAYTRSAERGRLAEAYNFLGAVKTAEFGHYSRTGRFTFRRTDLDVTGNLKFFDWAVTPLTPVTGGPCGESISGVTITLARRANPPIPDTINGGRSYNATLTVCADGSATDPTNTGGLD